MNRVAIGVCAALMLSSASSVASEAVESNADRPRVGLVLGGGGALDMAHVGVLKVLEELRIPVDYISGTSMGAIVGGLYAAGMSPEEIETLFVTADWWDFLDDKTSREFRSVRRKHYDARYLLDAEIGYRWPLRFLFPSGLASGQKLGLAMRRETAAVAGIEHFDELPIPFRAVATDLHTGEAVWLDRGRLDLAMRASMAVPGVFSPVEWEGRTLVDGGVVNNVPVDAARAMGADLVIAVDVVKAKLDRIEMRLSSFAGIVAQTYALMQRPALQAQLAQADVVLFPELYDQSVGDFHLAAEIMAVGEASARQHQEALALFSVAPEEYAEYLLAQRRVAPDHPLIVAVRVEGRQRVDERVIRARIRAQPGETLDFDVIEQDVARIHGLDDFERVSYELEETERGYELVYAVREKAWGPGYLHFGLRLESNLDDESLWQVLLNYTRTRINALGAELAFDVEVGSDQRGQVEFYQPLTPSARFFIAPRIYAESMQMPMYEGNRKLATYNTAVVYGEGTVGLTVGESAELRAGGLSGYGDASLATGPSDMPEYHGTVGGWVARIVVDRLDDPVLPRSGVYVRGVTYLSRRALGATDRYNKHAVEYHQYISVGRHTVHWKLLAATAGDENIPVYDRFTLGGLDTLAGLSRDQLSGNHAALGQIGYRYRLTRLPPAIGDGVYLNCRYDAGNVWDERSNMALDDLRYSFATGLIAETAIGPCGIGFAVADRGRHQVFVSVGTIF